MEAPMTPQSLSIADLKAVIATQDDSGHWYVIPNELEQAFYKDLQDDSDNFDETYGQYRTGGDLNLIQLYAVIPPTEPKTEEK